MGLETEFRESGIVYSCPRSAELQRRRRSTDVLTSTRPFVM
jgi:hypothetical protein